MQTYYLASSPFLSSCSSSSYSPKMTLNKLFPKRIQTSSLISMKAAAASSDAPEVDYGSMASSVFPAEACDTLGGVACDVEMFPETKLKQDPPKVNQQQQQQEQTGGGGGVDREYLQYDSPKTVFITEACDDLGGEFCDPTYQTGPT